MASVCEDGVYQLEDGYWAYRFSIIVDGRRISRKKRTDEQGKKLRTRKLALKAREAAIGAAYVEMRQQQKPIARRTVHEVFREYCQTGRNGKAYQTIRKQDSLWENHLSERFGKRFIDDISVAEVQDYLAELYYQDNYAYKYVEGFLKMFYLIFGQAYSRNYLAVDTYNKLCVNKDTKIGMPKLKAEEDLDIVVFSNEELSLLDEYFRGSNAETAYLLGRYCGLRINECYGLKWSNVDLEKGTILIDRQMQYEEGIWKLVHPKTNAGIRTIEMSKQLKKILLQRRNELKEMQSAHMDVLKQNETMLLDMDGKRISSLELVNSTPEGKMQTVNSMKYWSRKINEEELFKAATLSNVKNKGE